jgi:hypothetical protein
LIKEEAVSESKKGDPIAYLQDRFEESINTAEEAAIKLRQEAGWRRFIAYALKAIAIFGGISITAGLRQPASQIVGIVITVAIAFDTLFSNHKRLLAVTSAANAYSNLLSNVKDSYNIELGAILKLNETDEEKARKQLQTMVTKYMKKIIEERQKIDTALQETDLKLLNTISLEQKAESGGN